VSDAFIIAGQIHLAADEYERWLASPAPDPDSIDDWDAMYRGWFWKTRSAGTQWKPSSTTIEGVLTRTLGFARNRPFVVLLRYREDHFDFYIMSVMGNDDAMFEELFAVFRAASSFRRADGTDVILYWPALSGQIDFGAMLATALVRNNTCEFADAASLAMAGLDFDAVQERYAHLEVWYTAYWDDGFDEDSSAPRPEAWARPQFVDRRFIDGG